ncbi:hypothetical protein [Kitasatospora sp. GP82]|nr:hypothetical protein [Kitasatospora sp. GP82]
MRRTLVLAAIVGSLMFFVPTQALAASPRTAKPCTATSDVYIMFGRCA